MIITNLTNPLAAVRMPGSSIPSGGRAILADVDGDSLKLRATPAGAGATELEATVAGHSLSVSVSPDGLGHAIRGQGPCGAIDLVRRQLDSPTVSGSINGTPVLLSSHAWSPSESSITGYVGDRRVQVTQRRQFDGSVLSGYLGAQRFSLREREIPGQGVDLEPMEYLPILASLGQSIDVKA